MLYADWSRNLAVSETFTLWPVAFPLSQARNIHPREPANHPREVASPAREPASLPREPVNTARESANSLRDAASQST